MLAKEVTPSLIVRYLDQYVIGQEAAKKVLAVAVYSHYRKISLVQQAGNVAKSNVLLIGNSGTGKTLMCETLSRMLGVPFVTANATSLAQTQYVNQEIEAALLRLIDRAGGDIARAQLGIVFIDEIDKLKAGKGEARVTSGESVQHALLKIMEGAPVKFEDGRYIDTTNILFICGGAFVGLEKIMSKTHGFGFIATSDSDDQNILERPNDTSTSRSQKRKHIQQAHHRPGNILHRPCHRPARTALRGAYHAGYRHWGLLYAHWSGLNMEH